MRHHWRFSIYSDAFEPLATCPEHERPAVHGEALELRRRQGLAIVDLRAEDVVEIALGISISIGLGRFLWSIRRDHRPRQHLVPGGGLSSIARWQPPRRGRVGGAGGTAAHAEGPLVVAGRRGRPQVTRCR